MDSFIDVNKDLPEKTQQVEILVNGNVCKCMFYNEKSNSFPNGFFGTFYKMFIADVTHWRNYA